MPHIGVASLASEFTGLTQRSDLMRCERPGAQARLLSASMQHRGEPRHPATIDAECANPLGSIHFVCSERQEIDVHGRHVDHLAGRTLGGIDVKKDTCLATDAPDRGDVLQRTGLVVGVHDRNQRRVVAQRSLDLARVHDAVVVRHEQGHVENFLLERFEDVDDGLVLGHLADQVPPAAGLVVCDPRDRKVVRLGRARSEYDTVRVDADQSRDLASRRLDDPVGLLPVLVARRRVAEQCGIPEYTDHGIGDSRIHRRRRGVVEVDVHA